MPPSSRPGRRQTRQAAQLTAALEAALLRRLAQEWENLNLGLFRGALRRPVLRLGDAARRLGQWDAHGRTLEISRALVIERPWGETVEVLKHEMAHQFVSERLHVDEPPHGPAFKSVCARLGIDAAAAGTAPRGPMDLDDEGADPELDRHVQRVRKLLALAQSDNQHEAETAASAAHKLMLRYNLEQEALEDPPTSAALGFVHLGAPSGRTYEHQRRVSVILAEHFFVEAIWVPVYRPLEGKRASVLEICGTRANLAMARHVHDFLHAAAERLWAAYKRERGITKNRDRRTFLAGVMEGFEAKLDAQKTSLREEGLVWVPGASLRQYFRARHPHVRSVSSAGNARNEAFAEGHRAGRDIVLSRPVSERGAGRARALGPARD